MSQWGSGIPRFRNTELVLDDNLARETKEKNQGETEMKPRRKLYD